MQNVILAIHLILALLLIGVVLLQRSEGGGLLSGGGAFTARGAANALTRVTWILATAFILTSISLTLIAARQSAGDSVIDQIDSGPSGGLPPAATAPAPSTAPVAPAGDLLPPPAADAPATPPAADAPATPPASN